MAAMTLAPAEIWRAPQNDATYTGFDPNLIYTGETKGGAIDVNRAVVSITAPPRSNPTLNFLTTPEKRLVVSVEVHVLDNSGQGEPFRIGVWSPADGAGYFLVYGPPPLDQVTAEAIARGAIGATLSNGTVIHSVVLGVYGPASRVSFDIDKTTNTMKVAAGLLDGSSATDSITSADLPALFNSVRVAFTVSSAPGTGAARVQLTAYRVVLGHERFWAVKVDDWRERAALALLGAAGSILVSLGLAQIPRRRLTCKAPRGLAWIVAAGVLYLACNVLLFALGSHPFDMRVEKLYAYVARIYGPDQLFYLPNITSYPWLWGGVPRSELPFPYGPVMAYLSTGVGWIYGPGISTGSVNLEYLVKGANLVFALADAWLLYAVALRIGMTGRGAWITTGLFLFNPALWFSTSIWGETHVVSIFFALGCVLMIERKQPTWAWFALFAACLTRPQMLVFGLLLSLVMLKLFAWRQNLGAVSWAVILTFLALLPLSIATSPSLPVDILYNTFHVQEGGANQPAATTLSLGADSIWPLVSYAVQGAGGVARELMPSSTLLVGGVTYQQAGEILAATALAVLGAAILVTDRRRLERGGYLVIVTLGIMSFLMFLTAIVATHFLLALPFLLLCRRWAGATAYWYVVAAWTVTTLVPMFGEMGAGLLPNDYPLLAVSHNPVTRFFVDLYSSDRFITVGVLANICAVVWLTVLAVRTSSGRRAVQAGV